MWAQDNNRSPAVGRGHPHLSLYFYLSFLLLRPLFMPLPVAVNGTISLLGSARQGDAPQPLTKRAMIIRMSEETLEALAAYPAHPPLQFEFGDSPVRTHTPPLLSCSCSPATSIRVSISDPPSSPCRAHKNLLRMNFTFAPL